MAYLTLLSILFYIFHFQYNGLDWTGSPGGMKYRAPVMLIINKKK